MTRRQFEARLRLGAVNAEELGRVLDGYPARAQPPGLLEAIREVRAADAAAKRTARGKKK